MPDRVASLWTALVVCAQLASPPAEADNGRHLLIISIDGLGADTFTRHRRHLPTLDRLATRGAWGTSRTVFPSVTWPAHATLATGRTPAGHGVVGNYFFDRTQKKLTKTWSVPAPQLVRAPTLWDVARAGGLSTAAVLWPNVGSATGLTWAVPEAYEPAEFATLTTPGLIAELEAAGIPAKNLSQHSKVERWLIDTMARAIAIHLVTRHRPRVLAVHFVAPDTIAHHLGPGSVERRWSLELADRYVADILAAYQRTGLLARTTVLIVSDHGFSPVRWRIDPDRLLHAEGLLADPLKPDAGAIRAIPNGYALFLYAAKTDADLDLAEKAFRKHGVVQDSYLPADYAKLGLPLPADNPAAPDRILVSPPEFYFKKTANKKVKEDLGPGKGMHGHHPDAPGNQPVFIAAGPQIKGRIEPIRLNNVDVMPTALKLLGLAPKVAVEGRVLTEILTP